MYRFRFQNSPASIPQFMRLKVASFEKDCLTIQAVLDLWPFVQWPFLNTIALEKVLTLGGDQIIVATPSTQKFRFFTECPQARKSQPAKTTGMKKPIVGKRPQTARPTLSEGLGLPTFPHQSWKVWAFSTPHTLTEGLGLLPDYLHKSVYLPFPCSCWQACPANARCS